jgi:hypothetical protein
MKRGVCINVQLMANNDIYKAYEGQIIPPWTPMVVQVMTETNVFLSVIQ